MTMELAIGILVIAFAWLLFETNFLTIRLHGGLYCIDGETCVWRLPDCAVTQEMKDELLSRWSKNLTAIQRACFADGTMTPLCGWGFAYQYRDFMPECKVEMTLNNVRYKMEIKAQGVESGIMAKVMKANKLTKSAQRELWAKQAESVA